MTEDEKRLNLLGILHYVWGGIILLVCAVLLLSSRQESPWATPQTMMFMLFTIVALFVGLLVIIAGRCLQKHVFYGFCLTMAIIECLSLPFGTTLGVFTIIALMKDSVKELFEAGKHGTEFTPT